jgi:hypothetical protein
MLDKYCILKRKRHTTVLRKGWNQHAKDRLHQGGRQMSEPVPEGDGRNCRAALEVITEALQRSEKVAMTGFGTSKRGSARRATG